MSTTRKSKFSPELAKLIQRIDTNTRAIAKLHSADQWVLDIYADEPEKRESMALAQASSILSEQLFALTEQRRNLKLQFEDEWKRLQTSA